MNRKMYQVPTMKIVKVQHTQMLAASDGVNANRSGYGAANTETWGDGGGSVKANHHSNPVNWDNWDN